MKTLFRWAMGCFLVLGLISLAFPKILDPQVKLGELFDSKEYPAKSESQTNPVVPYYTPSEGYANSNYEDERDEAEDRPDGTYSATVHYHNRNTGYSADYDLEVEVVDGEATTIFWPNGGYSDVDGDPDKEYDIDIDE
jgi:hypothetical protein